MFYIVQSAEREIWASAHLFFFFFFFKQTNCTLCLSQNALKPSQRTIYFLWYSKDLDSRHLMFDYTVVLYSSSYCELQVEEGLKRAAGKLNPKMHGTIQTSSLITNTRWLNSKLLTVFTILNTCKGTTGTSLTPPGTDVDLQRVHYLHRLILPYIVCILTPNI